jgi:hypothetical protein
MAFTEPPPAPPPASVQRFDKDGKPTLAQLNYEQAVREWQKRLAASIP